MQRRRPDSWAKYVSTPVVLLGVSYIPPATGINYSSCFAVGFVFEFVIRKRNFTWWSNYNYLTGAALDCGLFFYATRHEEVRVLTNIWVVNRHCALSAYYFFRAPIAQRWLSSQLVGQFCLHEQCVSPFYIGCLHADLSGMYRCRLRRYTFAHDVA